MTKRKCVRLAVAATLATALSIGAPFPDGAVSAAAFARERNIPIHHDECDKYDYLIALACGAIGGMIDIFLVGSPEDSVLGKWSDKQVDKVVKLFAKKLGWQPRSGKEDSIASAIGFLERTFGVNYDQKTKAETGNIVRKMSPRDHHMISLAHSPDIIGLFFSILNQFTSTSSFLTEEGGLITIKTETFELQGNTFAAKIFCGAVNWLGHLMSDAAGSSGSRGSGGRGTGIVMPFYELFQFCNFGRFSVGKDKQTLATIARRAFAEGYDLRFGLATAVPVVITDAMIRLAWGLRRHYQFGWPVSDCMPTQEHDDLRIMLLTGNGVLCLMDVVDAGLRSNGNTLLFFSRLNLVGWYRLTSLTVKEVYLRFSAPEIAEKQLAEYRRINEQLAACLAELQSRSDAEGLRAEGDAAHALDRLIAEAEDEAALCRVFAIMYERYSVPLPWHGDFDSFMKDKSNRLIFK